MIRFETIAFDRSDNKVPIEIEIDQKTHRGFILWGKDRYEVKSAYSDAENHWLNCSIKWPTDFSRSVITIVKSGGSDFLSIRIFGNPFNYRLSRNGKNDFVTFINELDKVTQPIPVNTDQEFEFESVLDGLELSTKKVCLYIGSNFYRNLKVKFTRASINGVEYDIDTLPVWPLPNELGYFIELGRYDAGEKLEIEYTFETRRVPSGASVGVGVFYGGLRNREFIQKHDIESRESYNGCGTVTVKERFLPIDIDEADARSADLIPDEDLSSPLICEIEYKRVNNDPFEVSKAVELSVDGQLLVKLELPETERKVEAEINLSDLGLGRLINLNLDSWIYNMYTNFGDQKTECEIKVKRGRTTIVKEKYKCRDGVLMRNVNDLWKIEN